MFDSSRIINSCFICDINSVASVLVRPAALLRLDWLCYVLLGFPPFIGLFLMLSGCVVYSGHNEDVYPPLRYDA